MFKDLLSDCSITKMPFSICWRCRNMCMCWRNRRCSSRFRNGMMMVTRWFAKHPEGLCFPLGSTRTLLFFLNADSSSSIEVGGTFETFFRPPLKKIRICVELFHKPAYMNLRIHSLTKKRGHLRTLQCHCNRTRCVRPTD